MSPEGFLQFDIIINIIIKIIKKNCVLLNSPIKTKLKLHKQNVIVISLKHNLKLIFTFIQLYYYF